MSLVIARIKELVIKNLDAGLDVVEQQELDAWINKSQKNRNAVQEFLETASLQKGITELYSTKRRIWENLAQTIEGKKAVSIRRRIGQWPAAAALLIGIYLVAYFTFSYNDIRDTAKKPASTSPLQNQITPGSYKAKLVLADGTEVILDSALVGKLAQQGNAGVMNQDGKLVYIPGTASDEVLYNTVITARGESYSLVLADHSKVWLNAASSIKFPVSFTGNERRVEITGEAYFEVAKDRYKPFIVNAGNTSTKVFGTHFNVNAYSNEPATKITLLEGNIQVNKNFVLPGQQAVIKEDGHVAINNNIDIDEVVAWKNGEFQFGNKTDIKTAMRQIERWYDIEVEYKGNFSSNIGGSISKNASVLKILNMLEKTGVVKFTIQNKKIIVMEE